MLSNMMIHSAIVERSTVAATTYGSAGATTWTTQFINVPCQIQSISARERLEFSRAQQEISHKMYHAGVIGILPRDRVLWRSQTFSVVGVRDIDFRGRLLTIDLLEITDVDGV